MGVTENARERDVARQMGFGGSRSPLPLDGGTPLSNPPVVEKLGLRPGLRVALIGVNDPGLGSLRSANAGRISAMMPLEPVDVIVYQVESPFGLRRIGELAGMVKRGGVLWVLWPTTGRQIAGSHVERAGNAAGLKCTWTTTVSGRLSGMKFIHRFADGR